MIYNGILRQSGGKHYLEMENGQRHFEDRHIWKGYVHHWINQKVCVRELSQKDYESNEQILIIWPDFLMEEIPFVEIYYNERLTKYPTSRCGHNAINVNGEFFNFSHLINENEIMDIAEFMYRPALGEFSPSPYTGKFEIREDGTAYYDKFGRNFMRSIEVIRITGINTEKLSKIYYDTLNKIFETPTNPKNPEKYRDFSIFRNSCTTMIRDGLQTYGLKQIRGVLPRDFFISAAWEILKARESMGLNVKIFTLPQLKVPEAPYSKKTPIFNPKNWIRNRKISNMKLV